MGNRKDIEQPPKALAKTTKASALNLEDCLCCTPSLAGSVLGRLSRKGGVRRPSKGGLKPPRPSPKGNETIDKVALRAGLHTVKASWKPQQTVADAVFFDLGSGDLVGVASGQEMFDEARRLGAKREAEGSLPRWTPPDSWRSLVSRGMEAPKFWRVVDSAWPYHYAAIRIEDWGSVRGRGKRSGTMVTGAMSDPPRGKKVYLDVLARAGFSREDREVLGGLGRDAELRAARALFVGLSHHDALTLGFVGAVSSEGLTRAQAYKALRWSPAARAVVGDAEAKPREVLMGLREGDAVEVSAKGLSRSPRTVTITGPVDTETGKSFGIVYVPTSSGRVRPGHRAGGLLSLRPDGTVRFQPTLRQAEFEVDVLRVVPSASAASSTKPRPKTPAVSSTKPRSASAVNSTKTRPKPSAVRGVEPPKKHPPSRMDHVLRDLRESGRAAGREVERKHVAKALRVLLHARQHGLSIKTPSHSFATTIDIDSGRGKSQFSEMQNAALRDLFGEDGGRRGSFMVLVSPFIGDSNSIPTGIRPERIEEFRRQVAKAAGFPPPPPYSEESKVGGDGRKAKPVASSDRMSDEEVQTLVTAFAEYANHHEETPEPLRVRVTEGTAVVFSGQPGASVEHLSVRPGETGFTVAFGDDPRLAELFLNTFAAPMRGDARVRTERTRSFAWAPKAEQGARWAKTMSDFSVPVPVVKAGAPLGVGRADHEERRDNRVLRLRSRADKARGEAKSRYDASGRDLPPWGEPIKIGHHSEKRHRRALERSHANMSRSVQATRKAERLDARADAAESNDAISSDDPRALERLQAKLAQLEADREEVKRKNRLARKGKLPDAENPMNPASIRHVAGERKYPMSSYVLKNLGAEIRRVRERIETLSKRQGRAARSLERGDVRVVENGELNRLQLFTDSKPPKENRTWLKGNGFRWARSEGAWQRRIGDGAWNAAMLYLDRFVEKRDDTPFARVEASTPKPQYTAQDVEFWREEFALLDAEFPGKVFDDATLEKVVESLRARKSGHPSLHASAYGEHRTGKLALEEAVALIYRYRRHARPRPRPRPKRPRTSVTSSMGLEAFVAAVQERGAEAGGQLFVSKGGQSDLYLTHYNVPKGTKDGARRDSNRLLLSLEGWSDGGAPPKNGKVKLEVVVADRLKDLRGRTTTPEKMVDVVIEMFRRHSAMKSV